jgi:hypothetical protein
MCNGSLASGCKATHGSTEMSSLSLAIKIDGMIKSRFSDDFAKSSKFKARESRVTSRTDRMPL